MPVNTSSYDAWGCKLLVSPEPIYENPPVKFTVVLSHREHGIYEHEEASVYDCFDYVYSVGNREIDRDHGMSVILSLPPSIRDGTHIASVQLTRKYLSAEQKKKFPNLPPSLSAATEIEVQGRPAHGPLEVQLQHTASQPTSDQALCVAIRNRTAAISFPRYQRFIDRLLCDNDGFSRGVQTVKQGLMQQLEHVDAGRSLSIFGPHAYTILKLATQAFLILECGVVIKTTDPFGRPDESLFDDEHEAIRLDEEGITADILERRLKKYLGPSDNQALPYLKRIVKTFVGLEKEAPPREVSPYCEGILKHRLTAPSLIELIWSYWLEEGMLVQTMNAIAWRFQNRRGSAKDPLVELEFDALRPLNNILWGYIQDEHNRLTVPRRAYEYQHHYGLSLQGKAVADIFPADSRSKFIEAFHNLLYRASQFHKEDRDATLFADGFPLLNALKEVHLILAEGAHNQFGDLTWTARGEMLIMQWMLARQEMREFLRGRYMVPYQETWMGAVDSMKRLQGWTDTSITHFHELAMTGERILLSIRYGDWTDITNIEEQAKNWARNSKPEIQRYLHGYQAVTGIDLTADTTEAQDGMGRLTQPSALLQRRLRMQRTATLGRPQSVTRAIRAPTATPMKEIAPPVRPGVQKYITDK
ncbi:hypothetical protein [Bradyrhizobium japonicum]|uniref:hypothetical protein n=1 Tax=Bradyrhizobium japonicum TaxID=375 RepID=UPI0012BC2694|nr:hypothetical protein [Bradyrhizobium japonicum]WLB86886.1 hypothetical protein QIH91_29205 [Bradyrhizobium japonicum USDA 135]